MIKYLKENFNTKIKQRIDSPGLFLLATEGLINTGISLYLSKSTNPLVLSVKKVPKEKALPCAGIYQVTFSQIENKF